MTTEETPVPPTIPFSRQAEEALLGAVLINPDAYFDVAHFLHADDFYVHRNGWIWEAFTALQEKHIPLICSRSRKSWIAEDSWQRSAGRPISRR